MLIRVREGKEVREYNTLNGCPDCGGKLCTDYAWTCSSPGMLEMECNCHIWRFHKYKPAEIVGERWKFVTQ